MKKTLLLSILGLSASIVTARADGYIYFENYWAGGGSISYATSNVPSGKAGQYVDSGFTASLYWSVGTVSEPTANDPVGIPVNLSLLGNQGGPGLTTYPTIIPDGYTGYFGIYDAYVPNVIVALPGYVSGPVTFEVVAWANSGPYGGTNYASSRLRGHSTPFTMSSVPTSPNNLTAYLSQGMSGGFAVSLVEVPPQFLQQPSSCTNIIGSTVTFTVTAIGVTPLSYQWSFNGTNIANATNSTLTLNNVQLSQAGNFSVSVSNFYGSVTSSVASLTIMDPFIVTQPVSLIKNAGMTAMFSVGVTGSAPLSIQWFKGNTPLTDGGYVFGSANPTLTLSNVLGGDAGNYRVVITNVYGVVTSSVVSLTVQNDPGIVAQPVGRTSNAGTTATFSVGIIGSTPLSYQWYKNSTPLTDGGNVFGSTGGTLTLSNVSKGNAGGYSVIVTNAYGVAISSAANLTVIDPWIGSQPTNQIVSQGQAVTIGMTAGGTTSLTYQWFKDGVKLINQTNSTLNISSFQFTNSGSYLVVVSNATGLAISRPAFLSITNAPLMVWGFNGSGQLGNGVNDAIAHPLPVTVASNVVAVAPGGNHSLFVKSDGSLWVMGDNEYGQLGDATTTGLFRNTPAIIANHVVAVAAGFSHSLFVKSDETLWAMGYNGEGELGNGTTVNTSLPVCVASNVVVVAAGEDYSLFVKGDGTLWGMGRNDSGELGIGNTNNQPTPVIISSNVVAVAAGICDSFFITADGNLWAMGLNGTGELGIGYGAYQLAPIMVASNVVAVAEGGQHSHFVKSDGTLWAMGINGHGELGNGVTFLEYTPVPIASSVVAVAAGWGHSLFVKGDGSLWATGYNVDGQLGNGTTNNSTLPVQVPNMIVASLGAMGSTFHSMCVGVPPPLVLVPNSGALGLSNRQFYFTLSGPAGSNAVILASQDMQTWTPLFTNPLVNGSLIFTDLLSTNFPHRFYKAALK